MKMRTTTTRTRITAAAAFAALAIAGCGGGGGADRSDPEAVAKAFVESFYGCGEDGAGVRADLAYPADAAEEHRAEASQEERPGGCEPQETRELTTALLPLPEPGIAVAVEVSNEDCNEGEVPMIEVNGLWYVDENEVSAVLICPDLGD